MNIIAKCLVEVENGFKLIKIKRFRVVWILRVINLRLFTFIRPTRDRGMQTYLAGTLGQKCGHRRTHRMGAILRWPKRRAFKWEPKIRTFGLVFRGLILLKKIGENSCELCALSSFQKCKNYELLNKLIKVESINFIDLRLNKL